MSWLQQAILRTDRRFWQISAHCDDVR